MLAVSHPYSPTSCYADKLAVISVLPPNCNLTTKYPKLIFQSVDYLAAQWLNMHDQKMQKPRIFLYFQACPPGIYRLMRLW